jgi:putative copper export protein
LTGAAVVVLAGVITAVDHVGSLSNIWTTAYGRTLLLKVILFAGVVVCGYRNWRRWAVLPSGGDITDRRIETIESLLAAAIVLVTSVLTEIAHP